MLSGTTADNKLCGPVALSKGYQEKDVALRPPASAHGGVTAAHREPHLGPRNRGRRFSYTLPVALGIDP
jgi:hypothetical protein